MHSNYEAKATAFTSTHTRHINWTKQRGLVKIYPYLAEQVESHKELLTEISFTKCQVELLANISMLIYDPFQILWKWSTHLDQYLIKYSLIMM